MSKTGSGDSSEQTQQSDLPEDSRRSVPLTILGLGILGLVVAILVGTQALPVLYAMLFPPQPPVPQSAQEISKQAVGDGLDRWNYLVDDQACNTLQFYHDLNAQCTVSPDWCGGGTSTDLTNVPNLPRQRIAECTSDKTYAVFAMRWQAVIYTADTESDRKTRIEMSRQVYWGGVLPPGTKLQP